MLTSRGDRRVRVLKHDLYDSATRRLRDSGSCDAETGLARCICICIILVFSVLETCVPWNAFVKYMREN